VTREKGKAGLTPEALAEIERAAKLSR
jgi:hypothetical protein